jgi:hypothetical protein
MLIKDGKKYITRSGDVVGPATPQPRSASWPWRIEGVGSFTRSGRFNGEYDDPLDLMGEYDDPSAPPSKTWRDVPVTMAFLADLMDAYSGADGHNLVVSLAANIAKQKL